MEVRDCLIHGWVSAVIPEREITNGTLSHRLSSLQTTTSEALLEPKPKVQCYGNNHTNTELCA